MKRLVARRVSILQLDESSRSAIHSLVSKVPTLVLRFDFFMKVSLLIPIWKVKQVLDLLSDCASWCNAGASTSTTGSTEYPVVRVASTS